MGIPVIQQLRVGSYIIKQKLLGRDKYPLVLMLEPLFRCNLACAGCGKIDYPKEILDQRLSVGQCIEAVEECGAPIVSIPGGEPLIHKEMPIIVEELIKRKKFNSVILNYDETADSFLKWYQQLAAESLGKKGNGIFPIISNMPKDNHSLMQLYLDGQKNNFYTFFYTKDQNYQKLNQNIIPGSLKFLKKKDLRDILNSKI